MDNTIQINKFSHLHDGTKIIFCKTDFLAQELENIKKMNTEVILISGNSDYVIDSDFIPLIPKNLKKWFAQNALFVNEIVECIPLGIENKLPSVREGHGVGYGERIVQKELCILNQKINKPSKFIYSNFNVGTNIEHRTKVREICINSDYIDWEEPNLTISGFFDKISEYEAVVCPQGNGPGDNHRIYETLYMGKIPITFNKKMFELLHYRYPVVLLESEDDLKNFDSLKKKIEEAKNKIWNKKSLYINFWIQKIKSFL
jgi:hypothetical protein